MTDIFLHALNASVAASWVVLAVIAARVFLKKAPRWMVCALWALVALRMLMPLIPEAPFSLIPSPEIIPPQSLYDAAPQIDSGVAIIDNVVNPVYTDSLRPTLGASVNPLQIWLAVFANLWVLGMIAMAVWALVSCLSVRRLIRERIRLDGNVCLCDRVESPFIFGLFHPIICLPSNLDEKTRDHVIAHEQAHLARRDHWWKPLGFALLTINWFNPIMWLAYILLCRDIELACDERVARNMDVAEKKAYSSALLACSIRNRHVTVCPLAFGEVGVKQRVKSVLHYKKPAFWIILVTAVLIALLAAGLLTNPVEKVSELRYNGNLYVLEHQDVSFLPVQENTIGSLRSILHNTTAHPDEEFQATNLDESLTGCPLFVEENRVYLQKYDGTCIAFRLRSCADELLRSIREDPQYILTMKQGHLESFEDLTDPAGAELNRLFRDVAKQNMTAAPGSDWAQFALNCDVLLTISPESNRNASFSFFRTKDFGWICMRSSDEFGESAWCFDGSHLDALLQPYTAELERLVSCFPTEFDPWLHFVTYEQDGTALRVGIPGGHLGSSPNLWTWEQLESDGYHMGLRCRPSGRESWMNIRYYWTNETIYGIPQNAQMESITLPSGIRGQIFHTGNPDRWYLIVLETTRGHLHIECVKESSDWTDDEYRMALSIISTISLSDHGSGVIASPNPLGISLSVQNVTPNGAILICQQDGTLWNEIITGSAWTLERWTENGWVSIMPESTAWTTIAYLVNQNGTSQWQINWSSIVGTLSPGRYRIGKHFTGERRPPVTLGLPNEEVSQTIYAEFVME